MARGRVFGHIQANLVDFLKNLTQKRVGVRHPSGSAPDFLIITLGLRTMNYIGLVCVQDNFKIHCLILSRPTKLPYLNYF